MIRRLARGAVLAMSVGVTAAAWAAPGPKLVDERWRAHDAASTVAIDHGAWSALLGRYTEIDEDDGLRRFDYEAVTGADRQALKGYIAQLSAVPVSTLNRDEQMAFWMNLYNAYTVEVILENYPVDSIKDIGGLPFIPDGPWKDSDYRVTVEGQKLTLDQIEHGILRPLWRDPRVHYGVNCASVGCPNLGSEAFVGATVDQALDAAAVAFINSPRGVQFVDGEDVEVSSIYSWFRVDFGDSEAGVIAHLKQFARGELKDELAPVTNVAGHDYDWSLNDAY